MRQKPESSYFGRNKRGRPPRRGRPATEEELSTIRTWMGLYPRNLIKLGGNPLAWHLQAEIRRNLYVRFVVLGRVQGLKEFIRDTIDDRVKPYPVNAKLNLLSQIIRHIQGNPVVSIRGVHKAGLTLKDVGWDDFYREAALEFSGARPVAETVRRFPEDDTHIYIKLRRDVPKQEQMAALSHVLDMEEQVFKQKRPPFKSDILRSYGVMQFVDLTFYSALNGIRLPRHMVETLVLDQEQPEIDISHRVAQFSLRELKTTIHNADILLDDVSLPAVILKRQAIRRLTSQWAMHDGAGDDQFVLGIEEARQLVSQEQARKNAS